MTHVLFLYAGTDDARVNALRNANACSDRNAPDDAIDRATAAVFPEGVRMVAQAVTEVRALNPMLVLNGLVPAQAPGGRREMGIEAQRLLAVRGFDPGPADGIFGRRSAAALTAFQQALGVTATGKLDMEALALLRISCLLPSDEPFLPLGG
jgi:peptidoglycan hydrolase-like protein with peptidoglycan-binding domain